MAVDPITATYVVTNFLGSIFQSSQRSRAKAKIRARQEEIKNFMLSQGAANQGKLSNFYKNVNLTNKRTKLLGDTLRKGGSVYGR